MSLFALRILGCASRLSTSMCFCRRCHNKMGIRPCCTSDRYIRSFTVRMCNRPFATCTYTHATRKSTDAAANRYHKLVGTFVHLPFGDSGIGPSHVLHGSKRAGSLKLARREAAATCSRKRAIWMVLQWKGTVAEVCVAAFGAGLDEGFLDFKGNTQICKKSLRPHNAINWSERKWDKCLEDKSAEGCIVVWRRKYYCSKV
jgi:hypothetical protein